MTTEQALALILDHMLHGKGIDATSIVRALVKTDPVLLCKLAGLNTVTQDNAYIHTIVTCLRERDKIGAIKTMRMHTGMGLKESKDVLDYFCATYSNIDLTTEGWTELGKLRDVSGMDYFSN